MKIKVELKYQYGYSWFTANGISVKGYCYGQDGTIKKGPSLISFFEQITTADALEQKLKTTNGIFSVIIHKANQVFIAVDRTRTFPLFYQQKKDEIRISDDATTAAGIAGTLSKEAENEFLFTGYVTGKETLWDGVKQVRAGEYITLDGSGLHTCFYHHLIRRQLCDEPEAQLAERLKTIIDAVAERMVKALAGRTAIVPLSGGYDSRLIATLLRKQGYQKVICYTYGIPSSPEVVTSGLVARKLGLPWHFIHYTNALISGFAQSEDFNAYFPFAGNATSAFFTQDYFAVRYLKQHQLIPADAVFIPGHSGDFIAGGHLTPGLSPENLTTTLLQKHFSLRKGATSEFRDKIENSFLNTSADANFENWDLKERQAKFIINSNRIYEYWGFEHLIPLWDHELADFFPDIDLRYRLDKRLYDAVLFRHYFKPFQVDFTPKQYYSIVQKLKGVYNRIKRHLYTDNNNFKAIARELMRVGKPNVPWSSTQININSIQSAWYLLHFESQEKKKQK